jgi:tryptophanyl-tRNA synthetase
MSKSYNNTIPIFVEDKPLRKIVMSVQTDSTPVEAPKNPDTCNLYALLKLFMPPDRLAEIRHLYLNGGAAYGHIKQELFDLIRDYFAEARNRKKQLLADPGYIREVLTKGAEKARGKAIVTLDLVRDRVGLKY